MTTPSITDRIRVTRTVTAAEIAAYRDVVRSVVGPRGPDQGAPAPAASPVHAFVLAAPAFDQAISALSATGRVHLSQEIRLQRLVRPGERVAIDVEVLGARREPRGVRLALRSVLTGGDGSPLAELVTGALLVGATAPDPFGDIPPHTVPTSAAGPVDGTGSMNVTGSTSAAGPAVVVTRQISTGMIRRYAEASGDHNPIHLDPAAARAAGFPDLIAHGMSVLAVAGEEAIDAYAGGDAARIRGIGVRFASPVHPGQPLDISLQPDGTGRVVRLAVKTPQGPALKSGWVEIAEAGDG